ncbi:unnamed protein product [Rotaria sp. Silwood1]|nr:unnamed protein product [Rotaria sp. Silwood1]
MLHQFLNAEAGAIIFNNQSAAYLNFNTDGYAIGYEHGKKSTKEEKLTAIYNNGAPAGNPYVYGKQNNFYYLKIGFGKQKLLGGKNFTNGVAIQAIYGGGISLGMLKPYYLEVEKNGSTTNETETIKYDESDSRFLDPAKIYGSAAFGTGFGEIKFVPGAFVKGGFRFDYGRFNEVVSALEVGVTAEFYSQKMPIMALGKEKNFFISGYVSIVLGGRK